MIFLKVKNLKLYYDSTNGIIRAIDNISLNLNKGESLGIIGESGAGKTSLALTLIRALPENIFRKEGKIILNGEDIMLLSDEDFRKKIRWKKISIVFQGSMNALNPVLRVGYQVAEPLLINEKKSKSEANSKVVKIFSKVGLSEDTLEKFPHELSGGMKQRVMIAMALILDPALILLDEPTSALDVSIQAQIMNLLKKFKKDLGLSMIFITHDIALSSDICDEIAVLYAGEIIESGSSEQIFRNPLHPYTKLLLDSIPKIKSDKFPKFISGSPPNLISPPTGCRFHPRCPNNFDPCNKHSPPIYESENGHKTKCWLYHELKSK